MNWLNLYKTNCTPKMSKRQKTKIVIEIEFEDDGQFADSLMNAKHIDLQDIVDSIDPDEQLLEVVEVMRYMRNESNPDILQNRVTLRS